MELIHPELDNDLAGSWRSSQPPGAQSELVYIPGSSQGWSLKRGTEEASNPIDAWRTVDFDASGWESAAMPVGFGGVNGSGQPKVEWATELTDMQSNYTSVFLRRTIDVAAGEIPKKLKLGIINDDGLIVWVNGNEVFRNNFTGEATIGSKSDGAGKESSTLVFEEIEGVAGFFVEGSNVVAVQVFNNSIGGSDFGIDLEFGRAADDGGSPDPTPGRPNSVLAENLPPHTRQVSHTPQEPKGGEPVTISVKATDADGVAAVALAYQMVAPGEYIRKSDDEYETVWETMAMTPVEGEPDVYAAVIPAEVQKHRHLVRYRITATDGSGLTVQAPYADDEQPNFAYFVYDGVPEWTASDRSDPVTFPKSALEHLPIYHLIANARDVDRSQYNSGSRGRHFAGALVYDGVVYDHIEFSNRGEFSTYQSGKNKWRFHFNRAHDFAPRDNYGKRYRSKIKTMNMNACASPWVPVNRGMAGMEEALGFRMYELAGTPSPKTHWLHFRVIDETDEAPADDQYEGDVWGLYLYVEHPDNRFLNERNLEDGNTYKIEGAGNGDKKNQGPTQTTNTRDWTDFRNKSRRSQDTEWWEANFNLHAYYGFRAINRAVGNIDIREGWNHYFYHNPDGQWSPIPWDLDMLVMPETHWSGTIDQKACLRNDDIEIAFQNRCRELVDLLLSDKGDFGGQVAQLVEELATIVNPPELEWTMVDVDQFMWNNNPRSRGGHRRAFYVTPKNQGFQGGTLRRTLETPDHEGFEQYLKNYTTDTDTDGWRKGDGDQNGYGFEYLSDEADDRQIPERPTIQYEVGELTPSLPIDRIAFRANEFGDPDGAGTFGAREWRIGRVYNPKTPDYEEGSAWQYEVETVWQSDRVTDPSAVVFQFPLESMQVGATYRARVRVYDDTGRGSHWSQPVQFIAGPPESSPLPGLRISEIMYFPGELTEAERSMGFTNSSMEFLELHNAGADSVDLSRLSLTDGVDFDFADAAVTTLAPGEFVLVVSDAAAFEQRYGGAAKAKIAGEWGNNKLSNDGERLAIAFTGGSEILALTYGVEAPWPVPARGKAIALSGDEQEQGSSWSLADPSPGSEAGGIKDGAYSLWAATHFGSADDPNAVPGLDPDSDGFVNAVEFALASNPTRGASVPEFDPVTVDGNPAIRFVQRSTDLDGYVVSLQKSSDLITWSQVSPVETSSDPLDGNRVRNEWKIENVLEGFLRLSVAR